MRALSELFTQTTLVLPCYPVDTQTGEIPLVGHNLAITPLTPLSTQRRNRRLQFPFWLTRNSLIILKACFQADAIHTPIPGDIGLIGMVLAFCLRKPLFVRHCGNWFAPRTRTERWLKRFMERFAGGKNVMLATGGTSTPPSSHNPHIHWIFATSLTEKELQSHEASREINLSGTSRLIIVCRQEKDKGTGIVIESLPLILRDYPQVKLDVVGDGNALVGFKARAVALGLQDHICFHGKVNHQQVLHLLNQADLFCYPTTASEGFPKVVLEALACGLPVITTQVSVLPELLKTGAGFLLEESTPGCLAVAVCQLLADPLTYRAMSARAVETAAFYSLEQWRDTIGQRLQTAWGTLSDDA